MKRMSQTNSSNRTVGLAAGGALLAFPLAACGGSDDATAGTATSSTPRGVDELGRRHG